jgi:hypothetical protein
VCAVPRRAAAFGPRNRRAQPAHADGARRRRTPTALAAGLALLSAVADCADLIVVNSEFTAGVFRAAFRTIARAPEVLSTRFAFIPARGGVCASVHMCLVGLTSGALAAVRH